MVRVGFWAVLIFGLNGGAILRGVSCLSTEFRKNLDCFSKDYIFALLSRKTGKTVYTKAALVNRLRRLPFTEE